MREDKALKTLTPAYGRDYKTAKAVKLDWTAGKDFLIADFFDPYDGKPCNLQDAQAAGWTQVLIRFARLAKATAIKVS